MTHHASYIIYIYIMHYVALWWIMYCIRYDYGTVCRQSGMLMISFMFCSMGSSSNPIQWCCLQHFHRQTLNLQLSSTGFVWPGKFLPCNIRTTRLYCQDFASNLRWSWTRGVRAKLIPSESILSFWDCCFTGASSKLLTQAPSQKHPRMCIETRGWALCTNCN